jgi:phosphate-selective porin OprO/OprP
MMNLFHKKYIGILLVGVAAVSLSGPVFAADQRDERIKVLEQTLNNVVQELQALKAEQAASKEQVSKQILAVKEAGATQYADIQKQRKADVQVKLDNARPTFSTADGRFSLAIRSLIQYDAAYYSQSDRALTGTDLSSGSNFRRARIGVAGKAFGDWSYSFLYELGGSGAESTGLADAYIQYDGFKGLRIRTGAYTTPQGLDDQTGAGDTIFLERAAPADLARGVAGAAGRKNLIGFIASGENHYASLNWTSTRSHEAAVFDRQQAVVGRVAYRVYNDADTNILLSAGGSYVFKLGDTTAGPNGTSNINLQQRPENVVDGTRLVGTGNINASKVGIWGIETGANWKNLYAQAGYFGFDIKRRASALPNPNFDGWYVQGTWLLTGESRRYDKDSASWRNPRPDKPFGFKNGGFGAWELAARYSELDLNYNAGVAGTALAAGGIRGGKQEAVTVGLNWYPNNVIRFLFNYQHVNIDRLNAGGGQIGQNVDILAARAQLAF